MTHNYSEVVEPVDASSIENIQNIVEELQLALDPVHQIWCNHVWENGARFVVLPGKLPGKGMGIIATRDIEPGEQIAYVPPNLLYTTNRIPSAVKKKYPKATGHGLLAAGLIHEARKAESPYQVWIETWPTLHELELSMPVLLPPQYRRPMLDKQTGRKFVLLPPAIGGIWIDSHGEKDTEHESSGSLAKQEAKIKLAAMAAGIATENNPDTDSREFVNEQTFKWMWLMVNTRSFYYDLPLRTKPKTTADKMCLCPFLDYFNHDDKGCNVSYNDQGFSVTADRHYSKGEEVVISYGAHSNDLLWTDYGFLLAENSSDSVCIDAWMLDPSTGIAKPENQSLLEAAGYWKTYTLNKDGPCYRTEMAIRTQTLNSTNWQRMVNGENIRVSEQKIERDTKAFFIEKVLKPCIDICNFTETAIKRMDIELSSPMRHFALERWKQIRLIAENSTGVE